MSLKQEIETWVSALARYDNNEFDDALKDFGKIADTSKILFNIGVIHATLGEHEQAVENYQKSIRMDQYLAVAYFQQGVSNFLIGDFEEALVNFNNTLLYLRGNSIIDYSQLGLLFKLYSCEALFNRGLCYIYLQNKELGMQDLMYASKEKFIEDHDVIDDAIRDQAEGYTVFSIPVGVVYRPNEAKVRNLKSKDYLGKARLVAASDAANAFTGFAGTELRNASRAGVKDDRPSETISFAASNLVRPELVSRRQVSEPPLSRTEMPPTPPPEFEAKIGRGQSVRAKGALPLRLDMEKVRPTKVAAASPPTEHSRTAIFRPGSVATEAARRRPSNAAQEDISPQDVLDLYSSKRSSGRSRGSHGLGVGKGELSSAIEEDGEEGEDDESVDVSDFEMMAPPRRINSNSTGAQSRRRRGIAKVRIKVHSSDDVRYVMVNTAILFPDLVDRIRDKFGVQYRFRIRIRDDDTSNDDMITLGDQDDVETMMEVAKTEARKLRSDVGKMEMWIQQT